MTDFLRLTAAAVAEKVAQALDASECAEADCQRFMKACLPTALPGIVYVDEFHAGNLGVQPGPRDVWFVTKDDPQSVFFDELTGLFGACWGPGREDSAYEDIGFRSEDPVEMLLV